jgi:hypothetical protein
MTQNYSVNLPEPEPAPEMPEHLKPVDAWIKSIFASMTEEQKLAVRLAERQAQANVWAMRGGQIGRDSARSWHAVLQELHDQGTPHNYQSKDR